MKISTLKSLIQQIVKEAKFDDYGPRSYSERPGVNPEYRESMPYEIAVKLLTLAENDPSYLGFALSDAIISSKSSPDKLIALAAIVAGYPKDARSIKPQVEMLQDLIRKELPPKSSKIDKFF